MLRIAVVGVGRIATQAHLPAWRAEKRAQVTWVVDGREDVAMAVARDWGVQNWTTDYRDLVERRDVDAVDICLPGVMHSEPTIEFLLAGKHVLVEKPMAPTLDEARRMAAAATGATLMIAENWPFASAPRRALELLGSGALGEPFQTRASHHSGLRLSVPPPSEAPGDMARFGYTFAAGIHTLNLARLLMGEFTEVVAYATPCPVGPYHPLDTDVAIAARFAGHRIGSFDFTGRSRHLGERRLAFEVFASEGVVSFDVLGGWVDWTAGGKRYLEEQSAPSMGYLEEVAHFVDCVASGARPITSADDQLLTMAAAAAVYNSIETGRPVQPERITRAPVA